jgi:membrane protease subunit (stomatin/prohibitin family)
MGLWDTLKQHAGAQFLDVIEWLDDSRNTIVYRFPIFNQAIQDGGKLVVREGQAAVFINEGKLSEVFGPGTYELSTRTKAVWSFFETIKYQLNYPYKGDIYFVNTRQFMDQKWGTSNPIMLRDADFGPTRIRAYGTYTFRVTDPAQFLREVVATDGLFTTNEIEGQLKRKLVSQFTDAVVSAKVPVLDLGARFSELGEGMSKQMTPWFQQHYGITLTDFTIENVSLPPNVEKALDKRTSMGVLGDLNAYSQFQAANALEDAAKNPGSGGAMMNAGMGFAMGNVMANQMAQAHQPGGGQFNPQHGMAQGPPPPPPSTGMQYHYHGPGNDQGQFNAQQIAQKIAANREGAHNIWAAGWPGWKPWSQVPEIAGLVPPASPPGATFHYHGASGQAELSAQQIAAKVRADPGGRHMVWKQGFDGWKDAKEVPEIAAAMSAGGPPPPPGSPPPPPM